MLGSNWLVLSTLIFVIALITRQAPLFLMALLFLMSGGVSRLWNRFCLHRVEVRRKLSRTRVFFGEEITYEIEVANRKPLPLPWLQIEDELPKEVILLKGKAENTFQNRVLLNNVFPIKWYHKITRRYPMRCTQRGVFAFGPTRIRSGDLFGLYRKEKGYEKQDFLTVYPRLIPLEKLGIPSRQLFGDIRIKSHLFQDPVLTAGARDYSPGDSLKRIHWKSSARLGRLLTKINEPTTTVDISIFLDVRTVKAPLWGGLVQLEELGVITAAAIAKHALEADYGVGLYVNQLRKFSDETVWVPHSRHADQLLHILEALAEIHHAEAIPISRFIRREAANLPWGSTLMVISAQPNDELTATLGDLEGPGRNIALVKIGGAPGGTYGERLSVYHVPDDVAWETVDRIDLDETTRGEL